MVASRSSGVSFAVVVTVMVALPALPEVGETVHQDSARVVATEIAQSEVAVNEIFSLPPSVENVGVGVPVEGKVI